MMGAAVAEFDEPPMSRMTTRLAHSIPVLVVSAIAARVAFLIKLPWTPPFLDSILTLLVVAGVVALGFHLRKGGLCLRCIRNVPLDPERDISRTKFLLWQFHWSTKRFWKVWLSCWLCTMAGAFLPGAMKMMLKLPMDVLFFTLMYGLWTHHRLMPWCPYCRGWDEGGEEELVPDPDPVEKGTR